LGGRIRAVVYKARTFGLLEPQAFADIEMLKAFDITNPTRPSGKGSKRQSVNVLLIHFSRFVCCCAVPSWDDVELPSVRAAAANDQKGAGRRYDEW
jgi:hypothetical protein